MSFKVKDKVRVISGKFEASGEVSSIIEGKVYSIKYHNPAIDEIDMYWIKPDDIVEEYISGFTSDSNVAIPSLSTSLRYNSNKIQTREVDPKFILGIGDVLTKSREKYPEMNWSLPTKYSTPYDSAMRHLQAFWGGEDFDSESGKHHLLHAATNLMFLYFHVRQEDPASDDRGFKGKK